MLQPIDTNTVVAPMDLESILDRVQKLTFRRHGETDCFRHYDEALREVWPGMFIPGTEEGIRLSVALFFDVAERKGFEVSERNFQRPNARPIVYRRDNRRRIKVGL